MIPGPGGGFQQSYSMPEAQLTATQKGVNAGLGLAATGVGLVTAPAATIGGLVGGYAAGKGTRYAAKQAGAGETGQDIAEAGGNIVGGIAGGMGGQALAPNAARAGARIQAIVSGAKDLPVSAMDANAAAMRAKEIFDTGGSAFPAPIRKFLLRVQNPDRPPLTLAEARDFYMNSTSLTAKQWSEFNAPMKAQLVEFTKALGGNIGDSLDAKNPGSGAALREALDEYHNAKTISRMGTKAIKVGGAAIGTAGLGAAGYAGWKTAKDILFGGK